MIALTVVDRKTNQLSKLLKGNTKKLKRQVAIAVNATAKKTTSIWSKEVGKKLATAQRNIKETISVARKADPKANATRMTATVRQKRTDRIPLRDFRANQTKKGVSYRISKGGKRGFVQSAFIVKSIGGHAFKRIGEKRKMTKGSYAGKMRQPITKLFGASPWGVTKKNRLTRAAKKASKIELEKQLERRIRFLKLKQSGAI